MLDFQELDAKYPAAQWSQISTLPGVTYVCCFCGLRIASSFGYSTGTGQGYKPRRIYICPHCKCPTFFDEGGERYPGNVPSETVSNIPSDLEALYNEARMSCASQAFTAAVMVCRKMLMNVSVNQGAVPDLKFWEYVEFLSAKGIVPSNARIWVDYIRDKGNEANHEIRLMSEEEAVSLLTFVGMLLRIIYEMPALVPSPPTP